MKKDKQYIFKEIEFISTSALRKKVVEEFKDSTIAFEHGYKPPIITKNKTKFKYNYIDADGVHCRSMPKNGRNPQMVIIPFNVMTRPQLMKLCESVNDYYNYCLTKA